MKKNKYYTIFYNNYAVACGCANDLQIAGWKKAGYNPLRTSQKWIKNI